MAGVSYEDVPVPPTDVTLSQYFNFEMFQDLGKRVVKAMQSKERLSATEAQQLNATVRDDIQSTFDRLTKKISDVLEVKQGENPEAARIKVILIGRVAKFIGDLGIWLIDKIASIISRIKECFQWCWQQAKELFQYLYTMLSGP